MSAACKCGAAIVWAKTETGARIPLDPKALLFVIDDPPPLDANGRVDFSRGLLRARQVKARHPGTPAIPKAMVNHWATCPLREEFQRRRGRTRAPAATGATTPEGT